MDDLTSFASPARALGHPAVVKALTASTSDDARALAAQGAAHGTLVIADAQTSGRGRRGRQWVSPPGENLYASFVLRPRVPPHSAPLLSLVAGLAIAEALDAHAGGAAVRVKWPNDVRVDRRKLAGVLVEGSLRGDRLAWVVLGVGVNVRGESAPRGLDDVATTLRRVRGADLSRAAVLASLCLRLEARLADFEREGFAALRDALSARCETLGTRVRVDAVEGVAEALGPDGALRVRADGGELIDVRVGDVA